jgi:FkbM family methyltransferase
MLGVVDLRYLFRSDGVSVTTKIIQVLKPVVERSPTLATAYRYFRDNRQILDDPRMTPMGFKLIGNSLMEKGSFEPSETEIVRAILQEVDVVINVGANIGYYCCIALQAGKSVVAFEPAESNLRFLYKNIRANEWDDKIEVYPLALSDRIGIMRLFGGGTGASLVSGWAGSSEKYSQMVPTTTLDNVLGSRFSGKRSFVLVDIEGAEKLMLEGARTFLANEPRPIWMVEISVSDHQPKGVRINPHLLQTFKIFWDNGYEAWTADSTLRPVLPPEVEAIVNGGPDTLPTHNFLFVAAGSTYIRNVKKRFGAESVDSSELTGRT